MLRDGAGDAAGCAQANARVCCCRGENSVDRIRFGAGRCVTATCRVCPQNGHRAESPGASGAFREPSRRLRIAMHMCLPFLRQQAGKFPCACPAFSSGSAALANRTSTARMAMGRFNCHGPLTFQDYLRPAVPSMDRATRWFPNLDSQDYYPRRFRIGSGQGRHADL